MRSYKIVYEIEENEKTIIVSALNKDEAIKKVRKPGVSIIRADEFNGGGNDIYTKHKGYGMDGTSKGLIIGAILLVLAVIAFIIMWVVIKDKEEVDHLMWIPVLFFVPGVIVFDFSLLIKIIRYLLG